MSQKALSLGLVTYWLVLLFSISCNVPPPSFVELSAPRGSTDALGPYTFSAQVNGAVDQVKVFWLAVTPESENQRPSLNDFESASNFDLNLENGWWRGELTGGLRVAQYYYYFEAIGPGGRSQEPRGGVDRFEVNALGESCVVDSDCLNGDLCHRQELYCFSPPNPCLEDAHCPRDRICNVDSGLCRFNDRICVSDVDCIQDQRCVGGLCQDMIEPPPPPPPPPPQPECEPACSEGDRCVNGMCIAEEMQCTADGQCGAGFACDLRTGLCEAGVRGHFCEPCGFDVDGGDNCGIGFACRAGFGGCRPICGSLGPESPECDSSELCIDGICVGSDELSQSGFCGLLDCISHEECESGRCDRGRCTIEQFCDVDADCQDQLCDAGICRSVNTCEVISCGADSLCLDGRCQAVNQEMSNCNLCDTDLDCGALSHCLPDPMSNTGYCFSMCETNEHCGNDERCYIQGLSLGYCAPNEGFTCEPEIEFCMEDDFEPNDELETASIIQVLPMQEQSFEGVFCPFNEDFYRLQADSDISYIVQVQTQVPSEYYLYNEAGEEIAYFPYLSPVDEGISFEVSGGTHYLAAQGLANSAVNSYQVTIRPQMMVLECNDDDNLEENDTLDDSYPVGSGAELTLSLCPADADWFTVRGREGELWSISLFLRPFMGEVQLSVGRRQEHDSGTALTWFYETDGQQTAEFTIQNNEPYYLALRCDNCTESIRYLLGLSR